MHDNGAQIPQGDDISSLVLWEGGDEEEGT